MKVFEIIGGKDKSEFLVEVHTGLYTGYVNGEPVCESSDYESVRQHIISKAIVACAIEVDYTNEELH